MQNPAGGNPGDIGKKREKTASILVVTALDLGNIGEFKYMSMVSGIAGQIY